MSTGFFSSGFFSSVISKPPPAMVIATLVWAAMILAPTLGCKDSASATKPAAQQWPPRLGAPISSKDPPRSPPRRPTHRPNGKKAPEPIRETAELVVRSKDEAQRLTRSLLDSGIAAREVTAVADIRGHRLFRRQHYRRALAWFEIGANVDPSYEPCIYNAARTAAKLGDRDLAQRYLERLRKLNTPMSKRRLKRAAREL